MAYIKALNSFTLLAFGWVLVSFVLGRIILKYVEGRRRASTANRLGCKPPPVLRHRLPLGIDLIQRALKSDRGQYFPVDQIRKFEEIGAETYQYTTLGQNIISTRDPKNIQALLATQFDDFGLGPFRRGNFMPLLGNGIFTSDGKGWEHARGMMRPQFAREQISDLDLEERHVQDMMKALPTGKDSWTDCVDLQTLFFRLTLDSSTEFLFGESVGSQLAELPGKVKNAGQKTSQDEIIFAKAFDRGQSWLSTRGRLGEVYWLVDGRDFRACCNDVHKFVDHFVERAQKLEQISSTLEKGVIKEKYVFLEALAAQTKDPIELRSQLLNILLAGRDTTASLLGWLFFELVRNAKIYAKLRSTVLDDFGTYENPKEITFAKLKNCQYLQYCNNEALRVYPVVPFNGRTATKDTTLPRGGGPDGNSPVFVRKNQIVEYSVHAMHHRKDLWGEDCDEFKPERWQGRRVGWEYLPFNGGPRICIGRK
jgi:cytochrome P450